MSENNTEQTQVPVVVTVAEIFKKDLETKLWITRGARFVASDRFASKNNLSGWAVGCLSAYLIILSLLSAYKLDINLSNGALSFTSTSVSILVLMFSQMEISGDYKVWSKSFHQCALEVSEIYNNYKLYKNLSYTQNIDELAFIQGIVTQYENILKKYENHKPVDYEYFQCNKPSEFGINLIQVLFRRINYFIQGSFIYYALIFLPPILFFLLVYFLPQTPQPVLK
ncbi:SLATT domain-containing protein [Hymenobacter fastidiosus]|uniref:SLATT domain-containing protein n=1 Tax=Hymenobacter fastidiosus TaxID=486264 RepID=A0ABP7SU33_9BACT